MMEGTRFNSFVYWRELHAKVAPLAAKLATRTAALLSQRRTISEVIADPPKLPADTVEPVQ
jgi:hypothetical protein